MGIENFTESLDQAFGTDVKTEETKVDETETEVIETSTEETKEATEETTEEAETEETEEETEVDPVVEGLKDKITVLGETKNPETFDEVVEMVQKGYDYDRIKGRQSEQDKLINQLYPQFKNVTELVKAMRDNEVEAVKQTYRDKGYEDADIEKLIGEDERFKELESQVEELDGARNTEKVETDLKAETEALNKEFGTDYKSFDSVDKAVKEKASQHDITLSEAYYLVNKDTIISSKVKKTKQSMNADIKDKRAKAVPKNGSTENESSISDFDKKLGNVFGFDRKNLSSIAKKRKK